MFKQRLFGFLADRNGNIAIAFALLLPTLVLAVGASLDYSRAYNTQQKMQEDLDAAVLANVSKITTEDEDTVKADVQKWFAARTELASGEYTLLDDDIVVDATAGTIEASASSSVATAFMNIAGISTIPVSVSSTGTGTNGSYINIYVVLDKSASMLLAADTSSQTTMEDSSASCVFACHSGTVSETTCTTSGGKKTCTTTTSTSYDYARALGVTLRTDVQLAAVEKVLSLVEDANALTTHVKVGFYTLGTNTTGTSLLSSSYKTSNGIHTVLSPTSSSTTLTSTLSSSSELSSDSSYSSTDFRALEDLAAIVGTNGKGSSESDPLKLVMLITDGAQSSISWVNSSSYQPNITPMNPDWCDEAKDTYGVTMAVLYTEYLAVKSDTHYTKTLGKNMATSNFVSLWGGTVSGSVSTVRRDYIETALESCASKSQYFIAADDEDEIVSGFGDLLTTYLTAVRLTN